MPISSAKNSEQRDLFRVALEMMVLPRLRRQPMHGYALVQYIQQRSEELLDVEEGSLSGLATNAERRPGEGGVEDLAIEPQGPHIPDR
jgi:hypothetical protein